MKKALLTLTLLVAAGGAGTQVASAASRHMSNLERSALLWRLRKSQQQLQQIGGLINRCTAWLNGPGKNASPAKRLQVWKIKRNLGHLYNKALCMIEYCKQQLYGLEKGGWAIPLGDDEEWDSKTKSVRRKGTAGPSLFGRTFTAPIRPTGKKK